uniref:Uncharacterized protein n=1 Tax=Oryza glumipatula TaxID=40148 RepID=A0A0E0B073_9ORYZ
MANRPIRLASQARLLSGGGGAVAQQPPTQHAIAAQRRLPSRNPWSRIVPSLLPDGKSYHIIDTSFTSEEVFVPTPPPPLLVSTVRRPAAPLAQPIATMFAWPVPPRGWTVSPTTGRYRFGYGFGGESSSSTALRTPAAPTTTWGPAPLLPAPPTLAPPLVVPRGWWTVSPTTGNDRFGDGGTSSSTAAPLTPTGHSTPPEPVLSVPMPLGLTMSPTTAHYSFSYGGASSSSAMPRAPTAPLALRAPAPHLRVPRVLSPPAPMPSALATHVPTPPAPAPPVPTPLAPTPPADVPPGFTMSPTITRYSFGYDGPRPWLLLLLRHGLTVSPTMTRYSFGYSSASSPSAVPCTSSVPLALRALAPHLRALRVSVPRPRAPSASALPAAAPREWTVSLTTSRYSFGDSGASSSSAAPRAPAAPLALHAPAPHLRAPSMAAPPPAAPRGRTMPPTTGRYSFSYGGLSLSYTTPRGPIAPLALRSPAPHLRAWRVPTAPPAAATPRAPTPPAAAAAPAVPPAPPSDLPSWPVLVRPPTGPARARLAPATPTEAFEEYLVQRRAIEATVDDTPWEMIGRSRKTGGPMFAVAGGGRDRAELEAKEARERRKNRMDKRKAAAAARAQQPPPPPPADAPGSSGGGSKKRGGGRKKKQA